MESHVTATEASRRFSDLLNRVRYRGEAFIVERGGEAMCRIVPVSPRGPTLADFVKLLDGLPPHDDGFWEDVEDGIRGLNQPQDSPWGS